MKNILFVLLILSAATASAQDATMQQIQQIQTQWAQVNYQTPQKQQAQAYETLIEQTQSLTQAFPKRAEPLVWQAIILSSYSGAVGGLKSITKALPAVKKARKLLLKAMQINPDVLDGSIYTSLGSLYYQVPGWPIGFGDKARARSYLEQAWEKSNHGLEAGYFYGDFLLQQHEYDLSAQVLEAALNSPELVGRPVADQGRREKIAVILEQAKSKANGS